MSSTKQGTTITMPKLGESVTEGTLGAWLKKVGDPIEKYEPLVEVVTDKVTAEIPAPVSGTIVAIVGDEGETIPVGGPICVIDEGVEAGSGDDVTSPAQTVAGPDATASTPTPAVEASGQPEPRRSPSATPSRDLAAARASRDDHEMLRIRSSPIVRRLAEEHEIDLSTIAGTGLAGRVTKADITAEIERRRQQPAAAMHEQVAAAAAAPAQLPPLVQPPIPSPAPQAAAAPHQVEVWPGDEVIDASIMRRQIAEHMVRSVQTAPHVTVWMEADMSNVVAVRDRHKEEFARREGFGLTYFPFLVRVVTQALREHPNVNAVWDNGRIIRRKALNIGVAVALEEGLIVPVMKDADEKNIVGIARAVHDLAERARTNRLSADEVHGGTFTLNNPGTLGSLFSTPIIVQPQSAILSMEAIVKRAVVIDDAIAIRPMMNLSLSIDHRLLDGLAATRFLAAVKRGLETHPADASIY